MQPDSKVGTYAVSTIALRPWMAIETPTAPVEGKKRSVIKHPVFAECAQLIDDPFWKQTFENAARDRFPRGFTYRNQILVYKIKSKSHTLQMPQTAFEALPLCVDFMKKIGKLRSEADREQDRMEMEEKFALQNSLENSEWKDIKRKKVKALLLSTWINSTAQQYQMNSKQTEYFHVIVNIGFALGYLRKEDITFREGRIQSITGLHFNEKTKRVSIEPSRQPHIKKSTKNSSMDCNNTRKKGYLELWKQLLEHIAQRLEKKKPKTGQLLDLPHDEVSFDMFSPSTTLSA